MRTSSIILIAACLLWGGIAHAQGFKFSDPSQPEPVDAAGAQKDAKIRAQLSTACSNRLRNRKIVVLFAQDRGGTYFSQQASYHPHIEAINGRLQRLGLKTYTPEQIRRQIAQAEIDAYFRNDPDAAMAASKKLAAQYVLRGVIASQAEHNPMVQVNQVRVSLDFTLADASGRPISHVAANNQSYAGADVAGMALALVEERADELVAQLYSDYCRQGAR